MGTINGYTAEHMKEIEDATIVDGHVVGGNLLLVRHDATEIDIGRVLGDIGPKGDPGNDGLNGTNGLQGPPGTPALFPVGMIIESASANTDTGWLYCDGSAVSRTTYAALYAAIGGAYGVGDGTTTFNLPDRRGRVGRGVDATHARGTVGGADSHSHTKGNLTAPNHAHGLASGFAAITLVSSSISTQRKATQNWQDNYAIQGAGAAFANNTTRTYGTVLGGTTDGNGDMLVTGNMDAAANYDPYVSVRYLIKT